jgi:hypothetical protein
MYYQVGESAVMKFILPCLPSYQVHSDPATDHCDLALGVIFPLLFSKYQYVIFVGIRITVQILCCFTTHIIYFHWTKDSVVNIGGKVSRHFTLHFTFYIIYLSRTFHSKWYSPGMKYQPIPILFCFIPQTRAEPQLIPIGPNGILSHFPS